MRLHPPLLLLCSLVATTVALQHTRDLAVKKTYLDKSNFVLTWSLRMEGATSEQANNLTHCYKKCEFPSCLAFRFNETTGQCTKVTCSGISLNPSANEPLTFLRALHGVNATLMDDDRQKEKTINASNCLAQQMYYNPESMSMNLSRYQDNGWDYKLNTTWKGMPTSQAPKEVQESATMIGLIIAIPGQSQIYYTSVFNQAKNLCKDPNCFVRLCRKDIPPYHLEIGNAAADCGLYTGVKYDTVGIVARRPCCGATVPVMEFQDSRWNDTLFNRYYYSTSTSNPGFETFTGKTFYVWQHNYEWGRPINTEDDGGDYSTHTPEF